ncbi:MAG: serine/threonine-protein kinase [Myxococcota bacterium]
MTEAENELSNGAQIGRYTVEARLGEGGMAVVYRARHNDLGSLHAIKVLRASAPVVRERLMREGRVQASLQHAHIVTVTDVVDVGGMPGLVMEYVDGPSLDGLISRRKLDWDEIDVLARGVMKGVAAAHRRGVVHRDLKPANVLCARGEDGWVAKVADFGLVKALDGGESGGVVATRAGIAMGTPAYMAPEQIKDSRSVDHRADVWSLGVLLYELVSGVRAFPQEELYPLMAAVSAGQFSPVEEARPDVPERMARTIRAAMVLDRDARAPTVDALLAIWTGNARTVSTAENLSPDTSEHGRSLVTRRSSETMAAGVTLDPNLQAAPASKPPSVATSVTTLPNGERSAATGAAIGGAIGVAALAGVLGAAGLVIGLVVVAMLALRAPEPEPAKPPEVVANTPVATPPEPPAAAGAGSAPAEVRKAPREASSPTPARPTGSRAPKVAEPEPEPEPAKVEEPVAAAPPPEPVAAKPSTVDVKVSGGARKVYLVDGGVRYALPEEVPPGKYTIRAVFPDRDEMGAGTATIPEDASQITIACDAMLTTCRTR